MARIENVAIIGAGGHVGSFIVDALVEQGKHKITAITRTDSKATMPSGLAAMKTVDYSNHKSLVEALKGQDMLIITLGVMAKPDTQQKLVDACKDAGVKYVMPNEWGQNPALNEQMGKDVMLGTGRQEVRAYIEKVGLTWIGLCCSFCKFLGLPKYIRPMLTIARVRVQSLRRRDALRLRLPREETHPLRRR